MVIGWCKESNCNESLDVLRNDEKGPSHRPKSNTCLLIFFLFSSIPRNQSSAYLKIVGDQFAANENFLPIMHDSSFEVTFSKIKSYIVSGVYR